MPFPEPDGALRMRFSTGKHRFELRGPTACEVLKARERDTILARIGPDPLREDAKASEAIVRISSSNTPLERY